MRLTSPALRSIGPVAVAAATLFSTATAHATSGHTPFAWEQAATPASLTLPTGRPSELSLDVDADGRPDRVVADYQAGVVAFLATGATTTAWAPSAWTLASGDLNRDGRPDVVVGTAEVTSEAADSAVARTLLGDGRGGFTQGPNLIGESDYGGVAIGDFDGDGLQDVALASGRGRVDTYLGDGKGGLTPSRFPFGALAVGVDRLTAADYDGDGRTDLGATSSDRGWSALLLNRAQPGFRLPSITAPSRCVRGGRAHVVVRGTGITFVSFRLDQGSDVLRTKANTPGGGFLLSVPTAKLKRGNHRVVASVTYGNGQPATLKATLRRC